MAVHKLTKTSNNKFAFSECGICLHLKGGKASKKWSDVNCKNCIKHKVRK